MPGYANPQNLNRYSYVTNNPLRYTDPSGHMQVEDEGSTQGCSDPKYCQNGKPKPVPNDKSKTDKGSNACGQHGNYSSKCPGWHFYRTTNTVCPADLHCTAAQMQDYLYRFAYPSQDPNAPVRNGEINLVWIGFIPLGHIETEVNGLMITNVTQRDHLMYDGQVERRAMQASDGSWSVVTTGSGNNVQNPYVPAGPSGSAYSQTEYVNFAPINQALGPGAFNDLDTAMLNYIVEHQ